MKRKKLLLSLFTVLFLLIFSTQAFADTAADPAVASGNGSNSALWDTPHNAPYGATITSIKFSWNILQDDAIVFNFKDINSNDLPQVRINPTNLIDFTTITAPSGAVSCTLVIGESSQVGWRYVWYNQINYSDGTNLIFPDPPGVTIPSGSGGGTSTNATNTDLLNAINNQTAQLNNSLSNLNSQLSGIGGQLGSITSQLSGLSSQLGAISNQLSGIGSQLGSITSQLNAINGDLQTTNSQLSNLNNTVNGLNSYLTTPRQAGTLSTGGLNSPPSFDSTPPQIQNSGPTPYTYDRAIPQMPAFIDSPSPLPQSPDPTIMPHDNPTQTDTPKTPNAPINQQSSIASENPLSPQSPLSRQSPQMDAPLGLSPVHMDAPLTQDTVQRDDPIGVQSPLTPSTGYSQQAPLTPQAPLSLTP